MASHCQRAVLMSCPLVAEVTSTESGVSPNGRLWRKGRVDVAVA